MSPLPWAMRQLSKLREVQPELIDAAILQLLEENRELRWSMVVSAYLDQEINLGKAAELLEVHELELRERFIELGIPLRLGPETMVEAKAEADALEAWLKSTAAGG